MPQAERDAAELAECTFAPAVGRSPRTSAERGPAPERLHAEAHRRQAQREQAKRQLEEARMRAMHHHVMHVSDGYLAQDEVNAFPFAPHTNAAYFDAEQAAKPPLHERVADMIRVRDASRAAALAAAESARECTFAPRVDANSERIAAALRAAGERAPNVVDRLVADGAAARAAAGRSAAVEAANEGLAFAPRLTENTERIVASMDAAGRPADFVERQHAYALASGRQRATASTVAAESCTFAPDVGTAAEVLARSGRAAQLGETAAERIERLAVADAARKGALRRSLEAGVYGALPFAPELSAGTRRMQPQATPLDELVADSRRERARAAAIAAAEEARMSECTFQPDTTRSAASGPAPSAAQRRRSIERMAVPPCAMFERDPNGAAARFRSAYQVRVRCAALTSLSMRADVARCVRRSGSCVLSASARRRRLLSWPPALSGPPPTRATCPSRRRWRCAA